MSEAWATLISAVMVLAVPMAAYQLGHYNGTTEAEHECALSRVAANGKADLAVAEQIRQAEAAETHALERWNETQIKLEGLQQERKKHVARVTTGRACLSESAVRMLGLQETGSGDRGAGVPASAGAVPEDTGRAASDSDVLGWVIKAMTLVDMYEANLDGLRQWDENKNKKEVK